MSIGLSPGVIAATPFRVLAAVEKAWWRAQVVLAGGEAPWDADAIPEPDDPDGPPPEWLFMGYAASLGMEPGEAAAEWERQKAAGGYGPLPFGM